MRCLFLFFIIFIYTSILKANRIIVYRFLNKSSYNGRWDISTGFPHKLKERLERLAFSKVTVENKTFQANKSGYDYGITGIIREYKFKTGGLVLPGVGGYQNYRVEIKIDWVLYDYNLKKSIASFTSEKEIFDSKIGLTLMGGPAGYRNIKGESLFERLQKVDFYSKEFDKTIFGQAVEQIIEDMTTKIKKELGIKTFSKSEISINLMNKKWLFHTGDNELWASMDFDDTSWQKIDVGAHWEKQGYDKYDGYAWYRVKFRVDYRFWNQYVILKLGKIDDADITYFNNIKVGTTGSFPPYFNSASSIERNYLIPPNIINYGGTNVIAVKVYDDEGYGGIYSGPVLITTRNIYKKDVKIKRE